MYGPWDPLQINTPSKQWFLRCKHPFSKEQGPILPVRSGTAYISSSSPEAQRKLLAPPLLVTLGLVADQDLWGSLVGGFMQKGKQR